MVQRDHMKMSFDYFQFQKSMLQTAVRSEKVDEKNGVICLVSTLPSWVMVLKLSEKVQFLQFCADHSQKFMSIKGIYIYASERSRYALSENGSVYMLWLTVSEILVFEVEKFWSWDSIFFGILIANISWTVVQTTINHSIFWKSVMKTFRCIYVNCLNRIRFLAEVSTKL